MPLEVQRMVYLAFFIFCVVIVAVALVLCDVKMKALTIGCIGLALAYLVELNGVLKEDWSYSDVDSVMLVTGIPIEILFGYFAGGILLVIAITYIPKISTKERRERAMQILLLATGTTLLVYAYASHAMPVLVGWSIMGLFGLSVSRDRTVPIVVGMSAFLGDWAVEGLLTASTEYYTNGWSPMIGLVFMFVGMFISGILTQDPLTLGAIYRAIGREEPAGPVR